MGQIILEQISGKGKLGVWTSAEVREYHNEVEQEDKDRQSIVQDILRESTDFSRRIIAPVEDQGGVTLSYVCPHCRRFPLEAYLVDLFWTQEEGTQLVVCGLRRPVQWEKSEQSHGHTRHEPLRGKIVSSARCTARNVRQLDQCSQAFGKPAEKMVTAQSRWWYRACKKEAGSE